MRKKLCIALLCNVFLFVMLQSQTVVSTHGRLRVDKGHVVNKNYDWISLAGNSMFWSNNDWGGEKYYNESVVKFLKSDWKSSIIRVAMGVEDSNGYIDKPADNKAKVKRVIDAAISEGLYVIIDWHSHYAHRYTAQAVAFFQEMARTYGAYDNVMYEIFNEPKDDVSWEWDVKPYAQTVINAIRAIDPDNLIIVGTTRWSQDVDIAANSPVSGSNIAYALHFYAGSHADWLRSKALTAMSKGAALFVTEWGTCDASGNGGYNEAESNKWMQFLKDNKISHCNWAVNDKGETASILKPGASSTGNWTTANYTQSGIYVRNQLINWGGSVPPPPVCNAFSTNAVIEAENYCQMFGIQTENCSEGGQNVGWIDAGDWMSYKVNIPSAGAYKVTYRVASLSGGGSIQLDKDAGATILGTVNVPSTYGWQIWTNLSQSVNLPAGEYVIGIKAKTGGFNINHFKIEADGPGPGFYKKIEAENFLEKSAAPKSEACSEGGLNMGWIGNGDWMAYPVTIPNSGSYTVTYRVASAGSGGNIQLDRNAGTHILGTLSFTGTGNWQSWKSVSHNLTLPAGTYNLGIYAISGGFNINWFEIKSNTNVMSSEIETSVNKTQNTNISIYPNPCTDHITIQKSADSPSVIEIIDYSGKIILRKNVDGNANINTTELKNGIYFVKVTSESGSLTEKIIKK